MPTAANDGVTIHYDRRGPIDAPTVVFIEGLGYGKWMWQWQRDPLATEYDTIVPDNRGSGESDAPPGPYTIGDMAADLEAVLAAAGVETAHVVGASMGGMISQQYAISYDRAASLTLICTSPGGDEAVPTPPETMNRIMNVPEDLGPREALRYKMAPATSEGFLEENPELAADIIEWRLESDAPEDAREAQAAAVAAFDASEVLAAIDLPALVMHGTADRVLPVENGKLLADLLSDARLELYEGAPHWVFIEESDAVTARLREFLDART
ncbi:MAG: alpha/beta fold hydrolase [Halobacteriaceae archaeon]